MSDFDTEMRQFDQALAAAASPQDAFDALCGLAQAVVGAKLFTIMTVDMEAGLARRAYTNDPENYPTSGTKPIERNTWFAIVHDRQETFVANTLADIETVFPDADLIGKLGCGSVINLPVVIGGELVATVNMLHREQYYTADRVSRANRLLTHPAVATMKRHTGSDQVDSA